MAKQKTVESKIKAEGFLKFVRSVKDLYLAMSKEHLPRIVFIVLVVVVVGGGTVFFMELDGEGDLFSSFFDSLWWGIVTITTVGYGDIYPVTVPGRITAALLMLGGIVLTSVFSGTIASIFVDRKIQEGKGLQEVNLKNHTLICGWNRNSIGIIESFLPASRKQKISLCLVNEMNPEDFQILKAKHTELEIRFVRGDFSNEKILSRASAEHARAAIFVPDNSGSNSLDNADERTILGVLAIKSMNSDIVTCAEILKSENEGHLKRANVDSILINGEFSGFLLSNASITAGVTRFVKEILTPQAGKTIHQVPVPAGFIGKSFLELSEFMLKNGKGIAVGIMSEEKKMGLEDMLSDDSSSIDAFIKKKFMEAEIDISEEQEQDVEIHIVPDPEYKIKDTDSVFILGAE